MFDAVFAFAEIAMKLRSYRPDPLFRDLQSVALETGRPESLPTDRSAQPGAVYPPFDIFQWLSPEAQHSFIRESRRRHLASGSRIYTQSEPGDEMFRVVSGSVRMSVVPLDGREALHSV